MRRRTEAPPRTDEPGRRTPAPVDDILALQRSAGNQAVTRALVAREPAAAATAAWPKVEEGMRDSKDVELLQMKLNWHLGFLGMTLLKVDGWYGQKTAAAIVAVKKANGEAKPKGTVDEATWELLDKEPTARGKNTGATTGTGPEYAKMTADGLIDITLATGFDEKGSKAAELEQIVIGLTKVRHYKEDAALAAHLRAHARGDAKSAPPGKHERWFVKEKVGKTQDGADVNAVIRLVSAEDDGSGGKDVKAAALAGINESDVFAYGGHARYGTGPDFDRNYSFVVHWDKVPGKPKDKSGDEQFLDGEKLEKALNLNGSIEKYKNLENAGAVELVPHAGGNIGIQTKIPKSDHSHTLGAYWMQKASEASEKPLAPAMTENRYRLWMFNACTSQDYEKEIRDLKTPQVGAANLDMHMSQAPTYSRLSAETILTYVDGVLAQETAAALTARLAEAQKAISPVSWTGSGFEDNPKAP